MIERPSPDGLFYNYYLLVILQFRPVKVALQKNILMNRIYLFLFSLLLLASCTKKEIFKVEGSVPDSTFNGSKIYMVALDGPISRNVDSTFIVDGTFHFEKEADSLCVKILRVPARFPDIIEDLVVVLEAGNLSVTLSQNSHGEGTRLNNILQSWKERKHSYDSIQLELYSEKSKKGMPKELIDSLVNYSGVQDKIYMSYVMKLMNENINNGIGLLLFKVNYPDLIREDKQRILKLTGNLYSRKDAQLKLMIENDRNSEQK